MTSILIVDDDDSIRTMFARTLKSMGDVEVASTGDEALLLLAARKFDVMLLDLHMPEVDGFTVLDKLASSPSPNYDTPIIVVTADQSEHAMTASMHGGAVFFLTKPVQLNTLNLFVQSTIRKHSRPPVPRATS